MMEEKKYYINFYRDKNGQKVKGNWKLSEEEVDTEKDSYLYKNKLELKWEQTAAIKHSEVEKIAEEHGISIADVLDSV
jgi:hypothetical protein